MDTAFATLWEVLVAVCRLAAPMAPFMTDWIHRELTGGTSVHMKRYPEAEGRRDAELEDSMSLCRQFAGMGRAAREAAGIRVRQPLRRLIAAVPAARTKMPDDVMDSGSVGLTSTRSSSGRTVISIDS